MDLMAARATFPDIDKALVEDSGEYTISGGDVKNEVRVDRSTPKSNPWPWLALIVAMLLAAGIWYLVSHPGQPQPTLTPGTSKIGISVTPGA